MDLDNFILLHFHETGEWLPDTWAREKQMTKAEHDQDPCGGRVCNECEIGGCDHGVISELNPELKARMEENAKTGGLS